MQKAERGMFVGCSLISKKKVVEKVGRLLGDIEGSGLSKL